jgi:hypothetical protein
MNKSISSIFDIIGDILKETRAQHFEIIGMTYLDTYLKLTFYDGYKVVKFMYDENGDVKPIWGELIEHRQTIEETKMHDDREKLFETQMKNSQ